jgi:hypothetical protein
MGVAARAHECPPQLLEARILLTLYNANRHRAASTSNFTDSILSVSYDAAATLADHLHR